MLQTRDDLLDPDRGDVQLWHVGRQVGITLIGAYDEGPGLGDHEVRPRHARVSLEDQRPGRLTLRFCKVVDVAVAWVGAECLGEYLSHVGAQLVYGGNHDVTRVLVIELLDALPEIGLDYLYANGGHVVPEAALFGEHRLALAESRLTMVLQYLVYNPIVLGAVARPMHVDPVRSRIGLE